MHRDVSISLGSKGCHTIHVQKEYHLLYCKSCTKGGCSLLPVFVTLRVVFVCSPVSHEENSPVLYVHSALRSSFDEMRKMLTVANVVELHTAEVVIRVHY
jgi:hypothetical protein